MSDAPALVARIAGRLRDRLLASDSVVGAGAAAIVGIAASLAVFVFKRWIDLVQAGAGAAADWSGRTFGSGATILIPCLASAGIGLLLARFIGRERHHGVAGVMEAIALNGGRLRYRRMPLKAIAAGASIGIGASVGPEDPSVQIGSNLGSFLGQRLRLSDERTRGLVAAGAAAGVAAAFNAPIAGVFFALEILLGEIAGGGLGVVLVAAVCSSAVTHALVGEHPAFNVPAYALHSALELPAYVVLGGLAGLVGGAYISAIYAFKDVAEWSRAPAWARLGVAGAIVGCVGLGLPAVLGVGYGGIEAVLGGASTPLHLLLVMLVAKLLMTALCVGSGFPGGVFAPSLFLGAMLGALVGRLLGLWLPGAGIEPEAFALVGMGAALAGAVHAPLTSILLLFEMTQDYRIMPPAMLAVATSLFVARRLRRDSVYTLSLARKGIRLERTRDVEVLEALTVEEVMQRDAPTISERRPATDALEVIQRTRHLGLAVLDERGLLVGIVAAQDLDRSSAEGRLVGRTVGDVCTRDVLTARPGETVAVALRRMSVRDVGRLPVVDPGDPTRLVGMLRRSDVVRAYDVAMSRRTATRHRARQAVLGASSDAAVTELVVAPRSACAGRRLSEVAWPRACVLASVRRDDRTLFPHGDTTIEPGDVLVAVADEAALTVLRTLCSSPA